MDKNTEFCDDIGGFDRENEDGWWKLLPSPSFPTRGPRLLVRQEPGALKHQGLVEGAAFSLAIWPYGPEPGAGDSYDRHNPEHRAIITHYADPKVWYFRLGPSTGGWLRSKPSWWLIGDFRIPGRDPDTLSYRTDPSRFNVPAGKVASEYLQRFATSRSMGDRHAGSMRESWLWPVMGDPRR